MVTTWVVLHSAIAPGLPGLHGGEQPGVQIERGFRCVRVVQPPEEAVDRPAGQHGEVQIDGMEIRPEILEQEVVVADQQFIGRIDRHQVHDIQCTAQFQPADRIEGEEADGLIPATNVLLKPFEKIVVLPRKQKGGDGNSRRRSSAWTRGC